MALIKCPECGRDVSDTCANCIHCGYSLHSYKKAIYPPPPAPAKPEPEKEAPKPQAVIAQPENPKAAPKTKKKLSKGKIALIVSLSATLALLIVAGALFSAWYNEDPFVRLYKNQPREQVEAVLGTPDETCEYFDIYEDIDFLGRTGYIKVDYDNENYEKLKCAFFIYKPADLAKELTVEGRKQLEEYHNSIINYFTLKHGEPTNDELHPYVWKTKDGTEIGITFHEITQGFEIYFG